MMKLEGRLNGWEMPYGTHRKAPSLNVEIKCAAEAVRFREAMRGKQPTLARATACVPSALLYAR